MKREENFHKLKARGRQQRLLGTKKTTGEKDDGRRAVGTQIAGKLYKTNPGGRRAVMTPESAHKETNKYNIHYGSHNLLSSILIVLTVYVVFRTISTTWKTNECIYENIVK